MNFSETPKGSITISWEIKDADGISVGIELSEKTARLPYEHRKRIVERLRMMILPTRKERRMQL